MLTSRGRLALLLGVGLYLAAWAFGSKTLYPVAVGVLLAVGLAAVWLRLAARPVELRRGTWSAGERVEGDEVTVDLELVYDGRLLPSKVTIVDRISRLGEFEVELRRRPGRSLAARYAIPAVPRGRYAFEETMVVVEDPFALEREEIRLASPGALLVYPRLVSLDRVFTDSGARRREGRRLLLRRPTGFDFHSVREYEEGESLRRVHWPTTARRGQLMVKELEDAPRDEVAVLLDASSGSAGEPPDSSFDLQVRAAGSILRSHAMRGRRTVLVVNSLDRQSHGLAADDADWRHALELLAAAEPTGRVPASTLLAEDASPAARALELTVVTSLASNELVDRLVDRAYAGRPVSLVYVDAASFSAGGDGLTREAGLLRLQAAGVPVAVLRRGDDLRAALGGSDESRAASG